MQSCNWNTVKCLYGVFNRWQMGPQPNLRLFLRRHGTGKRTRSQGPGAARPLKERVQCPVRLEHLRLDLVHHLLGLSRVHPAPYPQESGPGRRALWADPQDSALGPRVRVVEAHRARNAEYGAKTAMLGWRSWSDKLWSCLSLDRILAR